MGIASWGVVEDECQHGVECFSSRLIGVIEIFVVPLGSGAFLLASGLVTAVLCVVGVSG